MDRRDVLRTAATTVGAATLAATGIGTATAATGTATPAQRALRVHVVLFDGVEELDFAAPYEVFSLAGRVGSRPVDVQYVTATGPGTVHAAYGTEIRVRRRWAPHEADVLVVPGGGYQRPDAPGVRAEIARGTLPRALAAAPREGLTITSVCTGAMLLSAAGITRDRPCTTHHLARPDLEAQGGILKDARVVDDGDLVTAGGITSGLELGLWMARRELGPETALKAETALEYEARGTVWTRTPRTR
ncbi:DJ-1/PfpI family protein [Streptomyces coeruleoprunus]|uniref:DJ-1/PfpI family protein n=1 Tax=Streptomyces coeruleoprunus TaxID=285563 RepID=A0ABV9XDU3_9ACTN